MVGPAGEARLHGAERRKGRSPQCGRRPAPPFHTLTTTDIPSPPALSSLRPLDIGFLRRLCRTVNVVPVIARADSLTLEEREIFRHKVVRAPAVGAARGQSTGWAEVTYVWSPDPA